jgi:hypothetical protein
MKAFRPGVVMNPSAVSRGHPSSSAFASSRAKFGTISAETNGLVSPKTTA